jgi:hypothetical protein
MADVKLYLSERDERRRLQRRRFRIGASIAFAFAAVIGSVWFVFRSPFIAVGEVRVTGNLRLTWEAVHDAAQNAFGSRSFLARTLGPGHLLAWPNHIVVDRPDFLPEAERIELTRRFLARRIDIAVVEREPAGIWCLRKQEPARCFWFARDGALYSPAPEAEGSIIHAVSDLASEDVAIGTAPLPGDEMERVMEVLSILADSALRVRDVRYEDVALQELKVTTYDGPSLFFSLRFSPAYTALALRELRENDAQGKLRPAFSVLSYIDFRVENRVYYQ